MALEKGLIEERPESSPLGSFGVCAVVTCKDGFGIPMGMFWPTWIGELSNPGW